MGKKAGNDHKSIPKRRTKLLKQEDMQKMKEMGLEGILEEISQINTRDGIGVISAILLNALMQKERQMHLKNNIENKANGYYDRKPDKKTYIYTTNIVENLNSRLENTRVNSGGYFQSLKTAEVAIYVTINKIQTGKWKKPLPAARAALYELKQMFNAKFSS